MASMSRTWLTYVMYGSGACLKSNMHAQEYDWLVDDISIGLGECLSTSPFHTLFILVSSTTPSTISGELYRSNRTYSDYPL